jgi:hypothetical protein
LNEVDAFTLERFLGLDDFHGELAGKSRVSDWFVAAIRIAAHVIGLTVTSSQNGAESNTSGFHASSKDD